VTAAACEAFVERGDPLRWRAAMTAPPGVAREGLMALYAFNLEIARAGYVVSEPMLGEIRLRWWADAVAEIFDGAPPRPHEVCAPLAAAIRARALPRAPFETMIAAREWDCGREGFPDLAALGGYLEATAGGLAWLAARHLGAPDAAEPVVRDAGRATSAAAYLRAVPALKASGRTPLPEPEPAAVAALAGAAVGWLRRARSQRRAVPRACLPALLPAATAGPTMRAAAALPEASLEGGLETSEFTLRGRLLAAALTGRW
jgi:phytoene/squalene synthetase